MIRADAGMPVSRFAVLAGIPIRTYRRRLAVARAGGPPGKGPWPAPVVDLLEPVAAKYAEDWPAWGHRKIAAMMRVDGHQVSTSTVERALRRRDLLLPLGFRADRKAWAVARREVFVSPPTRRNRVWQMDFSDFETSTGGIWRLCAVVDYASKYCLAATVTRFMRAVEAEACLLEALAEACRCLGVDELTPELAVRDVVDETTGELTAVRVPVAVVTDNGGAFKGAVFARVFARCPVLRHVRTRVKSPGTNGVVERFFGTAKYEHLYREEIADGLALAAELDRFKIIYNTIRPHQYLGDRTPASVHLADDEACS